MGARASFAGRAVKVGGATIGVSTDSGGAGGAGGGAVSGGVAGAATAGSMMTWASWVCSSRSVERSSARAVSGSVRSVASVSARVGRVIALGELAPAMAKRTATRAGVAAWPRRTRSRGMARRTAPAPPDAARAGASFAGGSGRSSFALRSGFGVLIAVSLLRGVDAGSLLATVRAVVSSLGHLMGLALDEAFASIVHGDVPVGAVVVRLEGPTPGIVARRHNERELRRDPIAHAEMLALQDAAVALGRWRLDDCTLVATLEPCPMCAGAALAARIHTVVFGAADAKAGACGSLYNLAADPRLNHEMRVIPGVRGDEAAAVLRRFFAERRHQGTPR